jgi:voltage-dependent potassium channel beta subunit|tara:strand:- start:107 stop:1075 length:969 start_codon:yes stop_codon:yes gene_type:complete
MKYRNLGKSGLKISELSYGSWVTFSFQIDTSKAAEMMRIAYDEGVNFFDNAEAYANGKSEEIMGQALKKLGLPRDTYCLSSKVFWGGELPTQRGLSAKHIHDACNAALQRMQVDYLDLFFCHRPDPDTPIEETVRAMHSLILQGKIIYWGTSEWGADQIELAYKISEEKNLTPPTMEQPEYNIFNRSKMESEYIDLFGNRGLGTTIWSPLASGILTGKYKNGIPDGTRMNLNGYEFLKERLNSEKGKHMITTTNQLEKIADSVGIPLVNLALGWCLQNKNVSTVILGASNADQLRKNLKTVDYLNQFDDSLMQQIKKVISFN